MLKLGIGLRFAILVVAGGFFGFGMSLAVAGELLVGGSIMVFGILLAIAIFILIKPKDTESEKSLTAMLLGDPDDPVQRRFMVTGNISVGIHLLCVIVLGYEEIDILLGQEPQLGQSVVLTAIVLFLISFIVLCYESWRFYRLQDEMWWRLSAGPAANAGFAVIAAAAFWAIGYRFLGWPEAPWIGFYFAYWMIYVALLAPRAMRMAA